MNRTRLAVSAMAVSAAAMAFSTAGVANAASGQVGPAAFATYTCQQVQSRVVDPQGNAVVTGTSCVASGGAVEHGGFRNGFVTDQNLEIWLCGVGTANLPTSVSGSFCKLAG